MPGFGKKASGKSLPPPTTLPAPKKEESSEEEESDDDDLPSSDDDVAPAKAAVPPAKGKDGKGAAAEGANVPLLSGDMDASDAAAKAEEELKKLAASDPAAAKAMEMAQAIKNDPKAAALAAAEAVKNYKPPTAEELKASAMAAKQEAAEAAEAAKVLFKEMMEDRPPNCFPFEPVSKRMERYINLLVEAVPEGKLPPPVQENLKPGLTKTVQCCAASQGWFGYIFRWLGRIWNMLPHNVVLMLFGVGLCYFGGTFMTSIAAAEAFRTMGGEKALEDIRLVHEQMRPVLEANDKDDAEDLDGDGEADVDQLTPPQLMQRKAILVFSNVKDPQKIQDAVKSIYGALLAVLATLKLEFAATTAMAMGVADMVKKPLFKFVVPALEKVSPPPTHQWIKPAIDSAMRLAAIAIAWYIQQIISAFYSSLRGGKLFAQGFFNIIASRAKKGIILCPGVIGPDFDFDNTILDDVIGWLLATQGFMFQLNSGFALPFPFDIIFLPLTALEWYLRLQISSDAMKGSSARRLADHDLLGCDYGCCLSAGWANATPTCWGQFGNA